MRTDAKRGQALMELAIGLFVIVLLSSAIIYLVRFMTKSLDVQNQLRSSAPVYAARVEVDEYAFKNIFGMKKLHIKEKHGPTDRSIPNRGGLGQ